MTENPYAVTATEAGEAIYHNAKTLFEGGPYIPLMLWGDPGIGKTQAPIAAARRLGARLICQHVADREPTEMGGIHWEKNGQMVRLPPADYPMDDQPTILFFDEVPQAPMMNKNVLARIVLDRQIGEFRLGPKVYVCCAGNYAHNRAGTTPMPAHLQARLTHLDVVPSKDGWLEWAYTNRVHPFVTAYQSDKPEHHHKADPNNPASPNPRSWVRVSDIEKSGVGGQARKAQIIGTIGTEVGTSYLMRAELYGSMPAVADVVKDPKGTDLPSNRGVMYALVEALAAEATPKNIGAMITYTSRFVNDEEYQVLFIRSARARNPAITSASAYRDWAMNPKVHAIL